MEGTVKQCTVRLPVEVFMALVAEAEAAGQSLNEAIVDAVEREVKRRARERALADLAANRAAIVAEQGVSYDSVPLIRSLREGVDRRE